MHLFFNDKHQEILKCEIYVMCFVLEYIRDLIWQHIEKPGAGVYQCKVCGLTKNSNGLTALKNHVESKHLGSQVQYKCYICERVMHSANAYHSHIQKVHKNNK